MRYFGSQYRHSQAVADVVSRYIYKDTVFAQLYFKRAHVGIRTIAPVKEFYDTSEGMVQLFNKIMDGWQPPSVISYELYSFLKMHKDDLQPYFSEFVGRAMSINGDLWFKYDNKRTARLNLATEAYRALLRDANTLRDTTSESYTFSYGNQMDLRPDVRYTVYVDVPEDDQTRIELYRFIVDNPQYVWLVSEKTHPPLLYYKIWQFDTVSQVDNIYLLTSIKDNTQ